MLPPQLGPVRRRSVPKACRSLRRRRVCRPTRALPVPHRACRLARFPRPPASP